MRIHGLLVIMSQSQESFFREKNGILSHFILPYVGALLLAALWIRFSQLPSLFRMPPRGIFFIWSAVGLLTGIAVNRLGLLLEDYPWYRAMALFMKGMVRQAFGSRVSFTDAFLVALYSGIGEEALFRGALQPWLVRFIESQIQSPELSLVLGISGASVIFGLLHTPLVKELRPWTLLAIVMGFVFGALAAYSESLVPAILAHSTINFLNLLRLNSIHPDPKPDMQTRSGSRE
jgi:uncharacterized protein